MKIELNQVQKSDFVLGINIPIGRLGLSRGNNFAVYRVDSATYIRFGLYEQDVDSLIFTSRVGGAYDNIEFVIQPIGTTITLTF